MLKSLSKKTSKIDGQKEQGLVRDLNPGPRASEAQIIPLDQRATSAWAGLCPIYLLLFIDFFSVVLSFFSIIKKYLKVISMIVDSETEVSILLN